MHIAVAALIVSVVLAVTLLQPATGEKPIRIVACTMVRNDLPHLLEWIEFHIIQGVSHFYIYDDHSTDGLELLPKLYSCRGDYVTVIPVSDPVESDSVERTPGQGMALQATSFNNCMARNKGDKGADWVMVADTDEFIWSPNFDSMAEYLKTVGPQVTLITVNETRFGLGERQKRLQYYLEKDDNGGVRLRNRNKDKVELITDDLVFRGPNRHLGEPEEKIKKAFKKCKTPSSEGWMMCEEGMGKSLVRPKAVGTYYIHNAYMVDGESMWANLHHLRLYHFYLRSREDVELKAKSWAKHDPMEMLEKVNNFWTSIQDRSLNRFRKELRARMGALMSPSSPS